MMRAGHRASSIRPPVASPPEGRESPQPLVDLNTASEADLQGLPGIGPRLAERIVASRREHGPFATVADLTRVPGVTSRLLARLRRRVTAERPIGALVLVSRAPAPLEVRTSKSARGPRLLQPAPEVRWLLPQGAPVVQDTVLRDACVEEIEPARAEEEPRDADFTASPCESDAQPCDADAHRREPPACDGDAADASPPERAQRDSDLSEPLACFNMPEPAAERPSSAPRARRPRPPRPSLRPPEVTVEYDVAPESLGPLFEVPFDAPSSPSAPAPTSEPVVPAAAPWVLEDTAPTRPRSRVVTLLAAVALAASFAAVFLGARDQGYVKHGEVDHWAEELRSLLADQAQLRERVDKVEPVGTAFPETAAKLEARSASLEAQQKESAAAVAEAQAAVARLHREVAVLRDGLHRERQESARRLGEMQQKIESRAKDTTARGHEADGGARGAVAASGVRRP